MFAVVAAAVIGLQKLGEKSDELAVKKRDNNIDLRKKETKRSEIYSTWDEKKLKNFRICIDCWEEINRLSSRCKFCQSDQKFESNVNIVKTIQGTKNNSSDKKINCSTCKTVITVAISGNKCWKCGNFN